MKRLILIPLAVILLCCTPFFLFSEGKAEPLQTPTAVTQAPTVQEATPFDTETTLRVLTASGVREMTQKEVADMMGISQSYISRLEKKIIDKLREEVAGGSLTAK